MALCALTDSSSMTGDGLPLAYTQEELYDTVVTLRSQIKKEKELLSELDILFSFVSKLLDSVAETAFLGISNSRVTRNMKHETSFVFQSERIMLHYRLRHGWLPPRPRLIVTVGEAIMIPVRLLSRSSWSRTRWRSARGSSCWPREKTSRNSTNRNKVRRRRRR